MKSIKLKLLAVLLALFATTSCEKDESSASPSPSPSGATLVGTYSFESEENVIVKKWIENGVEVTPDNSDINEISENTNYEKNEITYEFMNNYKLIRHHISDSISFTFDYKIKDSVIFLSVVDFPQNDDDYEPFLIISNDKLYGYYLSFLYRQSTTSYGLSILSDDINLNILDSGLTRYNLQSLSQIQAGEKVLTRSAKFYYSKN